MRKSLFTFAALLLLGGSAWADSYRDHYLIRGSGRDIAVLAPSRAAHPRRPGCDGRLPYFRSKAARTSSAFL